MDSIKFISNIVVENRSGDQWSLVYYPNVYIEIDYFDAQKIYVSIAFAFNKTGDE